MSYRKEFATAVGTLACAVGIGFVMQSSEVSQKRYGNMVQRLDVHPVSFPLASSTALLEVKGITLTAGEFDKTVPVPDADTQVVRILQPISTLEAPSRPQVSPLANCEILADASPVAGAMVSLSLTATCLPNERISVYHNGLVFSEVTGGDGTLTLKVPALARDATFIIAFTNGEGAVAKAQVDELEDFERAVVQWRGETGLQIHAFEYGAGFGEEGHVWSEAPRDVTAAVTGKGGFITQLGNPSVQDPLMAEVYSFPSKTADLSGTVQLSVEAEVIEANCGREIEAQAIEISGFVASDTRNMSLSVPTCEARGTFLVLNNLLQDLTVAAR